MSRNSILGLGLVTLAGLSLATNSAHAQSFTVTATDDSLILANDTPTTATSHAAGPNGKPYTLSIEGTTSNGNDAAGTLYESWAATDFVFSAPATKITNASAITVSFADQASSYEAAGTLDFYLASNTAASIDQGPSTLIFDTTKTTNPVGVGTQLGTSYLLGSVAYTPQTTRGAIVTYSLALPAAAISQFTSQVNSGDVRLFMTVDASTPAEAANFYGFNSTSATATIKPTLSFTGVPAATPEPSSVAAILIGTGMVGLIAVRRRATK